MANEFKVIGKGMLKFSIFKIKIYEMTYLKDAINNERLMLEYKRDVEKKYSIKGWKEGFKYIIEKDKKYNEKAEWFYDNTVDFKKGDKLIIEKIKNKVSLLKNGIVLSQTEDETIAKMAFEPWLGEIPVDKELKNKLINNGK